MILLTNKAKVSLLLSVAIGVDESEFNKYIEEAQKFDLKPLVCEDFFYDLLNNKDTEPWKALVDGGNYEHETRTYFHDGIAGVVAYFAYARFFLNSNNVSTSFGIVQKSNPNSNPTELAERKNTYYDKRTNANELFTDVKRFIERKKADYPSWECGGCGSSESNSSFNTYVI